MLEMGIWSGDGNRKSINDSPGVLFERQREPWYECVECCV